MKKLLITVLAAIMASGAFAQDTAFPDIPAGHWASDAVTRIADLGIVIGFPDGTFRGNEAFTRYQASLVVSRLLDVIADDIDSRFAMTDEDIASLRNAVQELASNTAAQGVRLSAVEGAVASLSDNVASNTARLDALEGMDMSGMDPEAVQDIQNQIASLRVAADTAQAQAANAEALANDALDAVNALEAQVRENAAAIATLNDLVSMMQGQEVEGLPSGLLDRLSRNESDIANIREFVILLRRDQVALRDRVAALEASDADQAAAIADLDTRLTSVEDQLITFSGSIGLTYEVGRLSGDATAFDVDRIFGLGLERSLADSTFSTGSDDLNDDDDETDDGEEAQDLDDIDSVQGAVDVDLDLNIGFNVDRAGQGDPNAYNSFDAVIKLTLTEVEDGLLQDTDGDDIDQPFVFSIDEVTTTFDPIGAAPLTFQFGEEPDATFTPYVVSTSNLGAGGFVATVGAPDFLAFLDPSLTLIYGGGEVEYVEDATASNAYYRGARLQLSPLSGDNFALTLGGSFAQLSSSAGENADAADDNVDLTVFGIDGQLSASIVDVAFEWANSDGDVQEDGNPVTPIDASLFYVDVDVDTSSLPFLTDLGLNYRDIPADWITGSLGSDDDDYPFVEDQAGFKVDASLTLFIVGVDAYFDTYSVGASDGEFSDAAGDGITTTAFGVDIAAPLFAGFSLTGFFESVSIAGDVVDANDNGRVEGSNPNTYSDTDRDDAYETGFGVGLKHDGSSENALIDNLDLEFEFGRINAGFDTTHIYASADYELSVSIVTLTPYASFESIDTPDTDEYDETTIMVGTGLETTALDVFLKPSLEAVANYRTTDYTDNGGGLAEYTSEEFQWSVGLVLNEFIFDHSTLTARYGSYSGENIQDEQNSNGSGDSSSDISDGDENNGLAQSTSGYELVWNYYDLEFGYGAYTDSIGAIGAAATSETGGQYFTISYTVNF